MLSGGAITGWCVDAGDPTARVSLELFFRDVRVGVGETGIGRPEISAIVGFAVTAGFRFPIEPTFVAPWLDALGNVDPDQNLAGLISVRVSGTGEQLPHDPSFCVTYGDLAALSGSGGATLGSATSLLSDEDAVRVVAFYLPQYHPFPENSDWWGEGFTDWTNVSSAKPSFSDHYQPRLPADLGYYDLRIDGVQAAQVELARRYGISAFCYHYYWFGGTTLMTMPIERHIQRNYNLDFCLCWANENWSRRWDGSEDDLLITQEHSEATDASFIESVIPYFRNPRYLKIAGAPLLIVYRIALLADPEKTVQAWKERVRAAGFPDLHVCMAETFGLEDPRPYGADSSCGFPPHATKARELSQQTEGLTAGFVGEIFDYLEEVAGEIARGPSDHLRFYTAMPSWDNTSRRGLAAHIFHNASPEMFEAWLSYIIAKTKDDYPPEHRLVFINAWNEWAEGAYLEPDRRNGHAYLQAVRNALSLKNGMFGEAMMPAEDGSGDKFRQDVVRVVSTLSNANRQLARFVSVQTKSELASIFIERRVDAINRILPCDGARMNIEIVNGQRGFEKSITISPRRHLTITGWIRMPGVFQSNERLLLIWLKSLSNGGDKPDYVTAVSRDEGRADLDAHFGIAGAPEHSGFSLVGDVSRVRRGGYRVGALVASYDDASSAIGVSSDFEIYVE